MCSIRRIVRHLMTLLMVLLITLSSKGLSQVIYLCTMTGQVGPLCCCQHMEELEERSKVEDSTPDLSSPSCCELIDQESVYLSLHSPSSTLDLSSPYPQESTHQITHDQSTALKRSKVCSHSHARAPPLKATGPPLFIQYCTYRL